MKAIRSILSILLGVILAMGIITLNSVVLAPLLFSLPTDLDPNDPPALKAALEQMPTEAFGLIMLGWTVAAFAGGFCAAWLAGRAWVLHASIIGAVVLFGTLMNIFVMLPYHPLWVNILGPILPIPVSVLGGLLARPRDEATPEGSERLAGG